MKEKASRGIYISCAPLGYIRAESNKPLVIDNDESAIVTWIFNEYQNGNSMFAIAKKLNSNGYRAKRGNPFDRRGVARILSNPIYKGFLLWACDGETIYKKADHEPIINEAQFEMVQSMLKESMRKKVYKARDVSVCAHWLTGIIRCPVCGTTYVLVKGYGGRSDRLRCGKYSNASCTNNNTIKVSSMENLVLNHLSSMSFDDIYIAKDTTPNTVLETNNHNTIMQLKKALERAKQAFLQGIDTIEEYKKNKETITKEIETIEKVTAEQTKTSNKQIDIEQKIKNLIGVLNSDSDTKTKNAMVRNVINKIIINHETKELSFYFFD